MTKNTFIMLVFVCLFHYTGIFAAERSANTETFAPQKVLVSIKPYALIFESIKREDDSVIVLIEDGATAHDFQLRPSHLRKIAEADLVIWGGDALEPTLAKALKNKKSQLQLSALGGLAYIRNQTEHIHEDHSQEEHGHHDNDEHASQNLDPHIWLSVKNAQVIATGIVDALRYPPSATQTLNAELADVQKINKTPMAHINQNALIVYHDAYRYLQKDLSVEHSFVINENHNSKPSLRHWSHLTEMLQTLKSQDKGICIVGLPGFEQSSEAKKLRKILKEKKLEKQTRIVEIDPLASNKQYNNYVEYLRDSQQRLQNCLYK